MNKTRVGILFGGKSAEHEVSVRSARNVYDALDKDKFEPVLIGIATNGKWVLADAAKLLDGRADATDRTVDSGEGVEAVMRPESRGMLVADAQNDSRAIDVVFPILHGTFGEDGTIQGLLKLADVPFVGPSVLGSAIGMDKDVTKRLLEQADINIAPYVVIRRGEDYDTEEIVDLLALPLFVKPANLGSSVGISKVSSIDKLQTAIDEAFQYDNKILVESAITGREIECAVLGNENPQASAIGEVIPTRDFYSYEAKYIDESGAKIVIPADVPERIVEKIQDIAVRVVKVLECEGMTRVDVFLTPDEKVIVNEVNTIPGFTSISMYPKMWEQSGLRYTDLITKLIDLAIARYERDKKLKTTLH